MSEWQRVARGVQLNTFGHPVNYQGFEITDQRELDWLLALHEVLEEEGASDEEITVACVSFLRNRRLN
jgi:gluconate kinase